MMMIPGHVPRKAPKITMPQDARLAKLKAGAELRIKYSGTPGTATHRLFTCIRTALSLFFYKDIRVFPNREYNYSSDILIDVSCVDASSSKSSSLVRSTFHIIIHDQ